jgi:hypothetical protein
MGFWFDKVGPSVELDVDAVVVYCGRVAEAGVNLGRAALAARVRWR